MRLKVRELRDYLHLHEVPTQTCREKEELVDLVLDQRMRSDSSNERPISPELLPAGEMSSHAPQPESGREAQAQDKSPDVSDEGENEEEEEDDNDEEDRESSDGDEGLIPGKSTSLSDLSGLEDIQALSVHQLKDILTCNFVNFKGCCEKWELMERVTRLYNDLHNQGEDTAAAKKLDDDDLCRICMDCPIDCVLLECGHMVTCSRCGNRMNECPICRQYVVRAVHVFRS